MPPVPASCHQRPLPLSRTVAGKTGTTAGPERVGALLMSVTCLADGLDHRVSDAALSQSGPVRPVSGGVWKPGAGLRGHPRQE